MPCDVISGDNQSSVEIIVVGPVHAGIGSDCGHRYEPGWVDLEEENAPRSAETC
jgi:hypothetical protein